MICLLLSLFVSVGVGAAAADKLAISEVGTYIVNASLSSKPARLVLDSNMAGIWVRCSLFQGPGCETADPSTIAGAKTTHIYRQLNQTYMTEDGEAVYTAMRFGSVTVGGATFKEMEVYIVHNPLDYLPTDADGIFGMETTTAFSPWSEVNPSFALDLERQTFAMDQSASAFLKASRADVATEVSSWRTTVDCVRPITNTGVEEPCLPLDPLYGDEIPDLHKEYDIDPAALTIVMPSVSMQYFRKQYLQGCTAVITGADLALYHECPESSSALASRLPALAFEIHSWRFIVQPIDYLDTITNTSEMTVVLLGDLDRGLLSYMLGAPFLRKFPTYYRLTSETRDRISLLLCREGDTCSALDPNAKNVKSLYENMVEEKSDSKSSDEDTPPATTTTTQVTTQPNSADLNARGMMWWVPLLLLIVNWVSEA